jgi:hypothetical protein
MNKLIVLFIFLFAGISVKCQAQDNNDFHAFEKKEKNLMLNAYGKNDITAYRKHLDEFIAGYNKLSEKEKGRHSFTLNEEYYLLACLYANARDRKNAIVYLEKSKDDDYDELLSDHDLDNLRREPQFIKMLDAAKNKKSKFQITLQKAPAYNANEKDELPAFSYQSADDPNLAALRISWNLDSIAGKGNDLSQMINLMEWVHNSIKHDGSKGNPDTKNAMSLIAECRQGKTLNCRGLGIVLNEVYLAEGLKSRYITCMPKDTADKDCHVITMVWSSSLKKWVWMDPTFMAYVMNENGELLGIEEVRERLIRNKPLILNPDANWNHNTSQTKSDYLGSYMSKNLYKLECPLSSEYNYETPGDGKSRSYMQLMPGNDKPVAEMKNDKHGAAGYKLVYTNNPKTFWVAPPAHTKKSVAVKSNADYEQVMEQFKNYYNNKRADNIVNMFSDPGEMKSFFTPESLDRLMNDYGKMISYKYVARDDGDGDSNVALFKTVFDKSVHMFGISINENNKMETFRFETSSSYIDKLLAITN